MTRGRHRAARREVPIHHWSCRHIDRRTGAAPGRRNLVRVIGEGDSIADGELIRQRSGSRDLEYDALHLGELGPDIVRPVRRDMQDTVAQRRAGLAVADVRHELVAQRVGRRYWPSVARVAGNIPLRPRSRRTKSSCRRARRSGKRGRRPKAPKRCRPASPRRPRDWSGHRRSRTARSCHARCRPAPRSSAPTVRRRHWGCRPVAWGRHYHAAARGDGSQEQQGGDRRGTSITKQ